MKKNNKKKIVKIKIFGVGGAGCNAVNRIKKDDVKGVELYAVNTDLQVLNFSEVSNKIVLGSKITKGLGAGANPKIGEKAAKESEKIIRDSIKNVNMIFITAGLGGGTGTGASPVIAKIAQEEGALVIGIVTIPFTFEGKIRRMQATEGLKELKKYVDSIIVINNDKLLNIIGNVSIIKAFKEVDNILKKGVQTITDLIVTPALINLDFADICSVMKKKGKALIGIGTSKGDNKSLKAAKRAISSPLLDSQIFGASKAIVNITGGKNITIKDASDIVEYIRKSAGNKIDIIFGVIMNKKIVDSVIVTVIATDFKKNEKKLIKKLNKNISFSDVNINNKNKNINKKKKDNKNNLDDTNIPEFFKSR